METAIRYAKEGKKIVLSLDDTDVLILHITMIHWDNEMEGIYIKRKSWVISQISSTVDNRDLWMWNNSRNTKQDSEKRDNEKVTKSKRKVIRQSKMATKREIQSVRRTNVEEKPLHIWASWNVLLKQTPSSLMARAQFYSQYKEHNH